MAKEILKDFDPKTTVLVFAVSQKDMEEDPRFSFKPKKDGSPGYLQPYAGNEKKLKPFGSADKMTGYVVVTPTFTFNVLGKPATSASELRKQFVSLDNKKQKEFITDLFGKYDADIHKLMKKKIGAMQKTIKQLKEEVTRKELAPMLDSFVSFASDKLGLKSLPGIRYKSDEDDYNSFAAYNPSKNELSISTKNRHPMDVFRSIAHELVHHKQNEDGKLGKDIAKEGSTGSDIENEANAEAGKIMRWFAKSNPDMFGKSYVSEEIVNSVSVMPVGMRGLGNVTGEVSPTLVSQYVLDNQSYTTQLQNSIDNNTDGVYTWNDNNWWMNSDDKKKYHAKTIKTIKAKAQLNEGINDPGKLKAIFLAGGPGSGKDYVMNATLSGEGLREVNSDVAFEYLMQKNGLDLEMPDEERVERDIVRGRAKNITKEQERLALSGRLGLIINGTADDLEKIKTVKRNLEADGYETMMVFVNTSNDVSRERNVERGKLGKRKVPDGTNKQGVPDNSSDIRQEKWDLAQKNIGELQKIFGNKNFAVVDNTADVRKVSPEEKEKIETNFNRVRRMAQQFVRADNQNPAAKAWIEKEAQKRGITYQEPRATKTLTQVRQSVPNVVHKPDNELMAQARKLGLSYYGFGRFGRKIGNENKVLFHSKGGKLVRVQTMNEGRESINQEDEYKKHNRIKKKIKRPLAETPDDKFENYMVDPANREIGTDSLAKIYKSMTPGQDCVSENKKVKIVRKKLTREDNNIPRGGLPIGNGLGQEVNVSKAPGFYMGFANVGNSVYEAAQSIQEWALNPKTQQKFADKYGNLAEEKLIEAALKLEACGCGSMPSKPKKSLKKIKEMAFAAASSGKDPEDKLGTVPVQVAENVDKAKMKCNAPRAQSHGSGEKGKSHIVKACSGGKEKIVRFGQKGVKGSPKKSGESKAYANRRKRFKARHAKNIKKGKMSAAYWANKVKW
jgi:hypothetical protein